MSADDQGKEEQELDSIEELHRYETSMQRAIAELTYPDCVRSTARIRVVRIVKFEDGFEQDNPTNPTTRSIKDRLHSVLDAVVQIELALDRFSYMTPCQGDKETNKGRNNVDQERKIPGNGNIGGGPEQPSFDVILDVLSMLIGVRFVPEEMNEQRWCDYNARKEGRADE